MNKIQLLPATGRGRDGGQAALASRQEDLSVQRLASPLTSYAALATLLIHCLHPYEWVIITEIT